MPARIAGWTQRLVLTTVRMTWRAKTSRSPPAATIEDVLARRLGIQLYYVRQSRRHR
jgi:hypothetical protein